MNKRKQEIIKAAIELIVEEGLGKLTMKRVAEKMGFSEPAMYRHFKDKQTLVLEMVKNVRQRFFEIIEGIDKNLPPKEFFEKALCGIMAYLKEVRGVTISFLSDSTYNRNEIVRKELLDWYGSFQKRIIDYLESAKKRGEIRKNLTSRGAALLLIGSIQSLTIRYILSKGKLSITGPCKEILGIFLKGIEK